MTLSDEPRSSQKFHRLLRNVPPPRSCPPLIEEFPWKSLRNPAIRGLQTGEPRLTLPPGGVEAELTTDTRRTELRWVWVLTCGETGSQVPAAPDIGKSMGTILGLLSASCGLWSLSLPPPCTCCFRPHLCLLATWLPIPHGP